MAEIRLVSAPAQEQSQAVRVGKADLELARKLLIQARSELQPTQWNLLDERLRAAEHAWERLDALKRSARGTPGAREKPEQVPALGLVGGAGSAVAGASLLPLLALLAAFWATKTAGPELDPPPWLSAELQFEARLQDLADASKQVRLEIEAARERRTKHGAKTTLPPPVIEEYQEGWVPVSGEPPWRPCTFKGTGGPGPSSPVPTANWVECRYQCGKYEVRLPILSRRAEDCEEQRNIERAEELARGRHR